jgi:hypothetical protein
MQQLRYKVRTLGVARGGEAAVESHLRAGRLWREASVDDRAALQRPVPRQPGAQAQATAPRLHVRRARRGCRG